MPTPQELAHAYDLYLASRWLNRAETITAFEQWLEEHWCADGESEPARQPDATSNFGGADAELRLYRVENIILAYKAGRPAGCYRIPLIAVIPPVIWPYVHAAE